MFIPRHENILSGNLRDLQELYRAPDNPQKSDEHVPASEYISIDAANPWTSLMFVPWDGNLLSGNLRDLLELYRAHENPQRSDEHVPASEYISILLRSIPDISYVYTHT